MRKAVRTAATAAFGAAALITAAPAATAAVDPHCESGSSHLLCDASSPGPLTWTDVLVWPDNSRTTLTYQTAGSTLSVPCNPRQTNLVSYTNAAGQTSPTTSIRCSAGGWP
jgi:hypothetical protein